MLYRPLYVLGYIPKDNRVYLGDKELGVISYSLRLAVLEYQTAIMRKDFDTADKVCSSFYYLVIDSILLQVLPTIPQDQRTRVAHFLEKQGFKQQALAVSTDLDHKYISSPISIALLSTLYLSRFEIAMQLKDLRAAYDLAKKSEVRNVVVGSIICRYSLFTIERN